MQTGHVRLITLGLHYEKKYMITSIGLLSTSMTVAACSDKTETDTGETAEETVTHESIAFDWTGTSVSYEDETLSLPYENCEANEDGIYCYSVAIDMMIDEAQTATINTTFTATLDGVVLDDESKSQSYGATVELQNVSNSYRIVLDNEDDFWGSLDCT